MKLISFALTTAQVRNRTKTVTRRIGWLQLKAGTLLQPVVKAQGLKKGEHVKKIGGPIRVVRVRRERLDALLAEEPYGSMEVQREGFGGRAPYYRDRMTPRMFAEFFSATHGCTMRDLVTRIEFEYVKPRA